MLEGSVRKGGSRVRITAQLIDTANGAHLWADRFDGSLEDVFDLQDQVAVSVAGIIEPALQAAETTRTGNRPTTDLSAYDLYLRAYAMTLSSTKQVPEALLVLEQAIARDPCYGPALGFASFCCDRLVWDDRSENPAADRLKGIDFARRALDFGEDIGAMLALVDRALALNPNFARGWYISGTLRVWAGQPDIAIEHAETALRLSPRTRVGPSVMTIGAAHFLARRFDKAIPQLLVAMQEDPSHPGAYRWLACCYAHSGRIGEAREVVKQLRDITPGVIPNVSFLRNTQHRELYLSGLRMAAGEA